MTAADELWKSFPGVTIGAFGHFGDGNIHFNVRPPTGDQAAIEESIAKLVYEAAAKLGGSFSAEHGVGQLKTSELAHYKSVEELKLFRVLKAALDPQRRLNPGKVLAGT